MSSVRVELDTLRLRLREVKVLSEVTQQTDGRKELELYAQILQLGSGWRCALIHMAKGLLQSSNWAG